MNIEKNPLSLLFSALLVYGGFFVGGFLLLPHIYPSVPVGEPVTLLRDGDRLWLEVPAKLEHQLDWEEPVVIKSFTAGQPAYHQVKAAMASAATVRRSGRSYRYAVTELETSQTIPITDSLAGFVFYREPTQESLRDLLGKVMN
ncbi:MAG: hypothetical protein AAFZ52_02950 [Bacteroidota bacterium]